MSKSDIKRVSVQEADDAAKLIQLRKEVVERLEQMAGICARTVDFPLKDDVMLRYNPVAPDRPSVQDADIEIVCTSDGSFCAAVDFRTDPPTVVFQGEGP